jgi:hypothetical protein
MSELEMQTHLDKQNVSVHLKDQILSFIYHSNVINRKSKRELLAEIFDSGMAVRQYRECLSFSRGQITAKQNELNAEIADKIIAHGHVLSDVAVSGLTICLEKLASY